MDSFDVDATKRLALKLNEKGNEATGSLAVANRTLNQESELVKRCWARWLAVRSTEVAGRLGPNDGTKQFESQLRITSTKQWRSECREGNSTNGQPSGPPMSAEPPRLNPRNHQSDGPDSAN